VGERTLLLKHGKNVPYERCDACTKYARSLSRRGWCPNCEDEFRRAGLQKVADARRLAAPDPKAPLPIVPAGRTGSASDQTPEGAPG